MFCFQCQETGVRGCQAGGVCGKSTETADLQDLLIFTLKGLALLWPRAGRDPANDPFYEILFRDLYATITNTNFDEDRFLPWIHEALALKREFLAPADTSGLPAMVSWDASSDREIIAFASTIGVLDTDDEDLRSLRETITYALKGISAYATHASVLGFRSTDLFVRVLRILAALRTEEDLERTLELALETGSCAVQVMALLDRANSHAYGVPEAAHLRIDVRDRPGILVSGHDLKDIEELLEQTEGTGIDVYTHGEMIAAHGYPRLRRFEHLYANYGNSWWRQDIEFDLFRGPILMTTNCIIPVVDGYRDRIFTTGVAGYPKVPHIPDPPSGPKDFSALIALARTCSPPVALETGRTWGGFGHQQLWAHVDRLLELVAEGALKRVIVIGGCDGRELSREYYRELALALPKDTLILSAGCTKFMFSKLPLGDIQGIPRVLDAGQCNDCYSLVAFALRLQERLGLKDPNELPLSVNVAWYDQKAVAVLLALFHLGFKGMRLGPTFPAFFSPKVREILERRFLLRGIGTAQEDVAAMMQGR